MKKYETVDGKWWLFEGDKPIRPLTDKEAIDVIWGMPYRLTGEELEKLQEYEEPSNSSIGYERNIEHKAQGCLVNWLNEPCTEHIYPNGAKVKPVFNKIWRHKDCDICWESLLRDFNEEVKPCLKKQ